MGKRWRERVLSTTRGRVLSLLRRGPRTVNELAEALNLTDNGVRLHLGALERDGLVEQQGARRGRSRPSYVYRLTPEAEALFPRAYATVLSEVLGYVRDERGVAELELFLRAVGRRAGERARVATHGLRERVDAAVVLLGEMGGLAEVEEQPDAFMIRGFSCPMAAIVGTNPEACALAEEMVGGIVDVPVKECCDREGDSPRCAFRVARTGSAP
jgi:predicted ArsR family transcriptional regulator